MTKKKQLCIKHNFNLKFFYIVYIFACLFSHDKETIMAEKNS